MAAPDGDQYILGTFRNRTTNVNVYDNDILSYVTVNNVLHVSFDKRINVYDNDILIDYTAIARIVLAKGPFALWFVRVLVFTGSEHGTCIL